MAKIHRFSTVIRHKATHGTKLPSARNQRRIDRKKAALKAAKEMFKP